MRLLKLVAPLVVILLPGTVGAACSLNSDPISFGAIDPIGLSQSTGRLHVSCDEPTTFSIGASGESIDGQRVMRSFESEMLMYQLYPNPSYTVPWGDNSSIGPANSATNDGDTTTTLTVYAVVPPQRGILPGSYSGNLIFTLEF